MKRFTKAQMVQVEQLISYTTLLGLTGNDLISIGGKMEREKIKTAKKANMDIIDGFECLPFGVNKDINYRFKLKTLNGNYNFTRDAWHNWKIHSCKTNTIQYHQVDQYAYDLPKKHGWHPSRYTLLLDIHAGKIQLNF